MYASCTGIKDCAYNIGIKLFWLACDASKRAIICEWHSNSSKKSGQDPIAKKIFWKTWMIMAKQTDIIVIRWNELKFTFNVRMEEINQVNQFKNLRAI